MPDKRCCPVTSGAIAERVVVVYHVLPSVVRNEQKESMMTKADLVAQIAARANMTKAAAERSLNAMLESVQEMLAEDGKLTLTGFGTFVAETRQERQGRNPRTGDVITIAADVARRNDPQPPSSGHSVVVPRFRGLLWGALPRAVRDRHRRGLCDPALDLGHLPGRLRLPR